MKRPFYTISKADFQFYLELKNEWGETLLSSKMFDTYRECERFLQTLKIHLCFQTNFCRSKSPSGSYGYQIRTCWDELIAESIGFATREEREEQMDVAMQTSKQAIFLPFYNDMEKAA